MDAELPSDVPAGIVRYSEQITEIAATLVAYLKPSPVWTADSPAAQALEDEDSVAPLGFERPLLHSLIAILQSMGSARDHLVAAGVILGAPDTVLAFHTVLRTYFVALSQAFYLAEPGVDRRERVRRGMNFQLSTDFEIMNLFGVGTEDCDNALARRRKTIKDAKALGIHTTSPEPKQGKPFSDNWWLGDRPPSDTALLGGPLNAGAGTKFGANVYRILSASAHSQPHAILAMIQDRDSPSRRGDGYAEYPMGLSHQQILMWLCSAAVALENTVSRCSDLFGWNLLRWNSTALPIMLDWRQQFDESTSGR